MAKIRGIKPEFWTADGILEMSIPARLLFIGMWNFACDNGHLPDKPRQIKLRILPSDDVKIGELLDEMVAAGQILRVDGWITIPDLPHHQKPHRRWWATCEMPRCDVPEGASHAPSNRVATVAKPLGNRVATADGDGEVDCEGEGDGELKVTGAKKKPATNKAKQLPANWKPTTEHEARALAAGLVLGREVDKFRAHAAEKNRTAVNWNAAFTRWLMTAEDYATRNRPASTTNSLPLARQIEEPPPGLDVQQYDAWFRAQAAKHKANQ